MKKTSRRSPLWAVLVTMLSACTPEARQGPAVPVVQTGRVVGSVQADDGRPLPGALVVANGTDVRATTDAQGAFILEGLNPGGHTLVASLRNHVSSSQAVEVKAGMTARAAFMLPPELGRVTGSARLEAAGSHEGILITIPGMTTGTVTAGSGTFSLEGVKAGTWIIVASREGYTPLEMDVTVRADETATVEFAPLPRKAVPDTRTGDVAGTVRAEDGQPLSGALVVVAGTDTRATTDSAGVFLLTGVAPGAHILEVSRQDHVPVSQGVEVTAGVKVWAAFVLTHEVGRVTGTVRLEGASSHEGILVTGVGMAVSTTTDASGAFVLEGVKTGAVHIAASKEGAFGRDVGVTVRANATATVAFTLARAEGRITGTVRMEDGSAPRGIQLSVVGAAATALTDDQGAYTLPTLPAGSWTVVAHKDHYAQATRDVTVASELTDGVDFVLARAGTPTVAFPMLSVQGGVLTLTGGPFGSARGASAVTVGGVPVVEYLSWTDAKIVARVSPALASGAQPVVLALEAPWRPAVTGSVRVLRASTVAAVSSWGLGVRSDGSVTTWGSAPSEPGDLQGVVSVAAAVAHGVALKQDGSVVSWGTGQYGGAPDVRDGVAVAAAGLSSFVLRADGTLAVWGLDTYGLNTPPAGLKEVVGLHGGSFHVVAVTKDGRAVAWGNDNYGATAVPADLTDVVEVAPAGFHNVALRQDGTVTTWGSNAVGEGSSPTDLTGVVSVAAGTYHGCALHQDGAVRCWGNDPPEGLSDLARLVNLPNGTWSLALKQDGTLVSWGSGYGAVRPPAGLVVAVPPR